MTTTRAIPMIVLCLAFLAWAATAAEPGAPLKRRGAVGGPGDKSRTHEQVQSDDHGVAEITLERTRCFGTCPAYSVVIKADGTFSYKGEEFVLRKGQYTGTVAAHDLRTLSQFIRDSSYANLQDGYSRAVTDHPTVKTSVVIHGKRKSVTNYANAGPTSLWAVEQLIDKLLLEAKWDGGEKKAEQR